MSDNLKLTDINDTTDLRTLPKETPYLEAWRQFYSAALTGLITTTKTDGCTIKEVVDQAADFANESMTVYEATIQVVRNDQRQHE